MATFRIWLQWHWFYNMPQGVNFTVRSKGLGSLASNRFQKSPNKSAKGCPTSMPIMLFIGISNLRIYCFRQITSKLQILDGLSIRRERGRLFVELWTICLQKCFRATPMTLKLIFGRWECWPMSLRLAKPHLRIIAEHRQWTELLRNL